MNTLMTNFHFLRPEWFWALIPVVLLMFAIRQGKFTQQQDNWNRYIDAHLLAHLSISRQQKPHSQNTSLLALLAAGALVAALAGPSWEKAQVPSYTGGEPVVAVLSLAQSMNASDLTPSRLKRATHKLRDILARTQGDERGLIVYSDAPFVAAPLTNDAQVIEQMLPELSTNLMPVLGNRLDLAINEATGLLQRADAVSGHIVLLADSMGDDPQAGMEAAKAARKAGYTVSVLGAGTEAGATLQTAQGRAISNQQGETFLTKLPVNELKQLAAAGGGTMTTISADGSDLNQILPKQDAQMTAVGKMQDFKTDAWVDMGYWLLLIPVLLLPLLFRRGVIFGLAVVMAGLLMGQPEVVQAADAPKTELSQTEASGADLQPAASTAATENNIAIPDTESLSAAWSDLWKTPDQQGSAAFVRGDFASAGQDFTDPNWKAAADYRAGNFAGAAQQYASLNTPQQDYNLGNALAKSGALEDSLKAYDRFLEKNPEHADAKFNRELVAKLLEQQKKEEEQKKDQQDQQQNQSGEQQDQKDQSGEQQKQDQQQAQSGNKQDQKDQSAEQQKQDQQQAQSGDKQDQQQNQSDEKQDQQDQSGEQQKQDQQDQADEKQGEPQDQEQQAQSAEQQAQQQAQSGQQPAEQQNEKPEKSLLSGMLSDILDGNKSDEPEAEASVPGMQPQKIDQAIEQQLRKVPDDPSGLLRARIRQHYARLRAAQPR